MERVIRVRDLKRTSGGMGVFLDLPDLLPHFSPEGHAWTWAIQQQPELNADEGWDFNLPVLERDVERDPRGPQMTFDDLMRLGRRVRQVIWGEFLAAEAPSLLPTRAAPAPEVGRVAVAGLAAIDSTFWLVGGPSDVVERVAAACEEVDEVSPSTWSRADD